jgi:hypothetical protein
MPSPTTVLNLVRGALGLTNAVGVDQTLTADEEATGLDVFNDVLEAWSIDNLMAYATANQTFNTIAGQSTYTIGIGGDWDTDWPVLIDEPAYITYQTVSFQIRQINQEQYNRIGLKTQQNIIPQWYLYVNSFPLGEITLWPVPQQALPVTWSIHRTLAAVTSTATTISFPPGYAKGFLYTLAVELAPRFGRRMTEYPDILAIQRQSLAEIKRMNNVPAMLQYESALLGPQYYDYRGFL